MFNNNVENEADFCEAYKSQILNDDSVEKGSSLATILKILTILLLLAIIVAVSIYGYNYFKSNENLTPVEKMSLPPVSIQTLQNEELDDLKVELSPDIGKETMRVEKEEAVKVIKKVKAVETVNVSKTVEEIDIDKIANDVKLAIAKTEQEELKSINDKKKLDKIEPLQIPVKGDNSKYLEELAELTKEIDNERK